MPKRVVVSWSGGKDSAWTLHTLRQQPKEYAVIGLLTSINQQFNRVAIHGVRRELLAAQALSTGLPLWVVPLPSPRTNEHYARLTCVDPRAVPAECAGREYDHHLLRDLPASVDPCAENGEFHTFVYEGPMLRDRLAIKTGGTVERDGFVFADLLLASQEIPRVAPDPAILAG